MNVEKIKPSNLLIELLKKQIRRLQDRVIDQQSTINILTSQLTEYKKHDCRIHRTQTIQDRRVRS